PIHNEDDPCTAVTDSSVNPKMAEEGTAITPDRKKILSCQSGRWKSATGSDGGTGLRGAFEPLKGMEISCSVAGTNTNMPHEWHARVDDSGTPYLMLISGNLVPTWARKTFQQSSMNVFGGGRETYG